MKTKWFDLENKTSETKRDYLARVKYEKIVNKSASGFLDIIGNDLKPGYQYRIVTFKSFNAITVYEYLLKAHKITEIYIAVYRMNLQAVRYLKSIIDSGNIPARFILSSFFRENKKYERWCQELISYANQSNQVEVAFAWSHTKIFLAKTENGKHIVFEGSGNLSDNARIEQYIIEDNKDTYKFHQQWINDIFDEIK